jgi:predicted metal-dependent phosphoesterase TrpH
LKRSRYTNLGQQLTALARPRRADLHVHTTASDGLYTPSQVVALARESRLCAVAVTDHDTLAAIDPAVAAAREFPKPSVEVVPAVEITTSLDGRELHLLGYFIRLDHLELNAALDRLCAARRERFRDYVAKFGARGHPIPEDRARLVEEGSVSLGRRHVAGLLVACGFARTLNEAFHRLLGPLRGAVMPKERLAMDEAIGLVHAAGGVASLAHPPAEMTDEQFGRLHEMGLDAVEAEYAWRRSSPAVRLRQIAKQFGLAMTGGSDCHGPDPAHRRIGSYGIAADELNRLRGRCRAAPAGAAHCSRDDGCRFPNSDPRFNSRHTVPGG